MALYTEFYAQTSGSNLNSGSSTADASAQTYTSAVLAGGWNAATGVFTVATGNPASDGVTVGDFASIYVTAGATVATFVARITARDATTLTVSLTVKSGTAPTTDALGATTCKVGGAWKGPNAAVNFPFGFIATSVMINTSSHIARVNLKSGTNYDITAGIVHNVVGAGMFQGYTTSPGDGGRATIDGGTSGASYNLLSSSSNSLGFRDLIFQNNGATNAASGLLFSGLRQQISRIVVNSVRGTGINVSGNHSVLIESEVYACNQSNSAGAPAIIISSAQASFGLRLFAHDNTGSNATGIQMGIGALFNSIADTNGNDGFVFSATLGHAYNCDAYNNGADGFDFTNVIASNIIVQNCNALKNGGWGMNFSGSAILRIGFIQNCGFGVGSMVNTSGDIATTAGVEESGTVNYASGVTPWVDPDNGDFRVNLAAAKGKGTGFFMETAPSYTGTVGYPDIGAAQHKDSQRGYTYGG